MPRTDTDADPEERRFLERYRDRLSPSTDRARWIHPRREDG